MIWIYHNIITHTLINPNAQAHTFLVFVKVLYELDIELSFNVFAKKFAIIFLTPSFLKRTVTFSFSPLPSLKSTIPSPKTVWYTFDDVGKDALLSSLYSFFSELEVFLI